MTPVHPLREPTLAESLRLFEQNARLGVLQGPRYRCPYVVWGSGPPLVFVHGLADDLRSFVLPMALMSESFQCIAYNQPNGRWGGGKIRGYRHHDLTDDLWALLDHLRLPQVTLFGSSFGSTIALKAMHDKPERVARAIIQGGFARRPLTASEWWLAWVARYFPGVIRSLPLRRKAMLKVHSVGFRDSDPEYWRFFLEQSGKPLIRAVARWALLLHKTDVSTILPGIRQPTLLVCGDQDPLVADSCQQFLFKQLPNAMMFRITGCGHFPMFSHPRACAEAVRRFMHMHDPSISGCEMHCTPQECRAAT